MKKVKITLFIVIMLSIAVVVYGKRIRWIQATERGTWSYSIQSAKSMADCRCRNKLYRICDGWLTKYQSGIRVENRRVVSRNKIEYLAVSDCAAYCNTSDR